jgi:tRNA (adenine22-N1)-methyltransferase
MGRIDVICSYLDKCKTFADIGCDHGYCTQYMLDNNLCDDAIITDISAKSLNKAQTLLSKYIDGGRCNYICCDGLNGVESNVDLVLIAGMGGEEIVKILKEAFIPKNFVFQPMKNAEVLREYLLNNNCKLQRDDIFKDGKYYFIIKGTRLLGGDSYTQAQLAFGRDSLNNSLLKDYLSEELNKNLNYLSRPMTEQSRAALLKKIEFLKGVKDGEIK